MRDRVLVYAIAISVAVHLIAVVLVGSTFAARLSASRSVAAVQRHIEVDLVRDPNEALQPKPKPELMPPPKPTTAPEPVVPDQRYNTSTSTPRTGTRPAPRFVASSPNNRPAGNSGGMINTGTSSRNGDLAGFGSGATRVGVVPNNVPGRGSGSGTGEGAVTRPDPVQNAHEGPGRDAAPIPPPPPPPRRTTSARVCEVSGMLAGEHCKRIDTRTFFDGEEPRHTCNVCKAPEPKPEPKYESQLAEKSDPVLINSSYREPAIPSSVDEGLSVEVRVSYTVTAEGTVTDVEVTKSSGVREIDRAVAKATSAMRYKPAMQAGVARSVKMVKGFHIRT